MKRFALNFCIQCKSGCGKGYLYVCFYVLNQPILNSQCFFPFAIFAFFLISNPIQSQTFFYQHTLTVSPVNPTTNDTLNIYVAGDKSSTDIYLAGSGVSLFGTNVNISFHWNSSGIGLLVLVPWDSTFKVGPLPAGNYTVVLSGTYMNSTMNNVPFTVTGSGFPQCTGTNDYTVSSIPYVPPFPFTGGTQLFLGIDDEFSPAIPLPFTFCFYDNSYNQVVVGTNGIITFDLSVATGFCEWDFFAPIPTPGPPPSWDL